MKCVVSGNTCDNGNGIGGDGIADDVGVVMFLRYSLFLHYCYNA